MQITQPAEPQQPPTEPTPPAETEREEHFEPRGAMLFVSVMLAGFVVYWFALWITVTLMRGGA